MISRPASQQEQCGVTGAAQQSARTPEGTSLTGGPDVEMQFTGEFRGYPWNSQALFARRAARQHAKRRHVSKLAQNHDFVAIQETHSTDGKTKAFQNLVRMSSFWSHGSTHQAGVGLLAKQIVWWTNSNLL